MTVGTSGVYGLQYLAHKGSERANLSSSEDTDAFLLGGCKPHPHQSSVLAAPPLIWSERCAGLAHVVGGLLASFHSHWEGSMARSHSPPESATQSNIHVICTSHTSITVHHVYIVVCQTSYAYFLPTKANQLKQLLFRDRWLVWAHHDSVFTYTSKWWVC